MLHLHIKDCLNSQSLLPAVYEMSPQAQMLGPASLHICGDTASRERNIAMVAMIMSGLLSVANGSLAACQLDLTRDT